MVASGPFRVGFLSQYVAPTRDKVSKGKATPSNSEKLPFSPSKGVDISSPCFPRRNLTLGLLCCLYPFLLVSAVAGPNATPILLRSRNDTWSHRELLFTKKCIPADVVYTRSSRSNKQTLDEKCEEALCNETDITTACSSRFSAPEKSFLINKGKQKSPAGKLNPRILRWLGHRPNCHEGGFHRFSAWTDKQIALLGRFAWSLLAQQLIFSLHFSFPDLARSPRGFDERR